MTVAAPQALVLSDGTVAVEIEGDATAVVHVPWPLAPRDAATTAAGAAALLLLQPDDVRVLAKPEGEPRPLAETLRAVAAAIRKARA
jgi:hypothetical protein